MKVLLTGAFGNVGSSTLYELMRQGHDVRVFDLPTRRNKRLSRKISQRYGNQVEIRWGDLRDSGDVSAAVQGVDVIAHLAFIIPPLSERQPDFARTVNVNGTRNLITAAQEATPQPRFIFSSSVAVFGHQHDREPPRTVNDPIQATDHYTAHKIECENALRDSSLTWAILRFSAVQPLSLGNFDPLLFEVPLWQRIEFVHTWDVGLVVANAVSSADIWHKILLIAGGERCRMTFREYLGAIFERIGIGQLPEEAFATSPFHTDWMDTEESQRLLHYQRYTYDEFVGELVKRIGIWRHLIPPFRPVIRWWILRQSPYYRKK